MLKLTKASVAKLLHLIGYNNIKITDFKQDESIELQHIIYKDKITLDWESLVILLKLKVSAYYINKAKEKFGNKYRYFNFFLSPVDYIYYICPVHGTIRQKYHLHYRSKVGCPKCSICSKKVVTDTKSFIENANKIHNYKYSYDKVNYKNTYEKVSIICPIHGEFLQTPTNHLSGSGCPKCSKITFDDFLIKAREIHGDKYEYEPCENFKLVSKIKVTCPKHGTFYQEVRAHLRGVGCLKCSSQRNDTSTFIEKAKIVHNDIYDYSKVNYIHSHQNVEIICPKHGSFWQTPTNHLTGKGCPKCNNSRGESAVIDFLTKEFKDIEIINHYKCEWINPQHLDIYIPEYNIAIEYNCKQHYVPIECFGGKEALFINQERDRRKARLCEENGCKLFIIKYDQYNSDLKLVADYLKSIIN